MKLLLLWRNTLMLVFHQISSSFSHDFRNLGAMKRSSSCFHQVCAEHSAPYFDHYWLLIGWIVWTCTQKTPPSLYHCCISLLFSPASIMSVQLPINTAIYILIWAQSNNNNNDNISNICGMNLNTMTGVSQWHKPLSDMAGYYTEHKSTFIISTEIN